MDFKQRVTLGRTGLEVSRIGLASGYGVPAAAIERVYHEYGINYLYVSPLLNLRSMVRAVRNLAPDHRDDLFIVLARPFLWGLGGLFLRRFVERWLKKLGLEWVDLILQDVHKSLSEKLADQVQRLRDDGKVRFVGVSSHERPVFPRIARGEVRAPSDFFHVRYNAVHTGAEQDVFPHLPYEERPGIVIYTATCWRKLLRPKLVPPGESPLAAVDCYRFVLSHPDVDVCLTGPASAAQMEDNLRALDAGPLDEEEMARVRRIGKHIYQKS
jgi:aryl-alcohol dehydrogenase-like predicted oxidoreductase